MDDDEASVEATLLTPREVIVSVVARVLRIVLVVGGGNEAAPEALRTVEPGVLPVEDRERLCGARVWGRRGRGERDPQAIRERACRAGVHRRVCGVRQTEGDRALIGAAVLRDRAVPLRWVARHATDGLPRVTRQERRAAADVQRGVLLDPARAHTDRGGGEREGRAAFGARRSALGALTFSVSP